MKEKRIEGSVTELVGGQREEEMKEEDGRGVRRRKMDRRMCY